MVKRKRFLALGALMTALAAGIITVCIQYDLRSFVRMGDGVYDRYAQSLDLSGRQDVDFAKLPRFYNLRQLDLRNTGLTVEQFDWLRGRMPDCEIAWLVPFQGAGSGYGRTDGFPFDAGGFAGAEASAPTAQGGCGSLPGL